MEKIADYTKSIFPQIVVKNSDSRRLKIYPQMSIKQIQHYLKLAARKQSIIAVQFNPSSFSTEFTEVTGKIKLSTQSSQIILTPRNKQTIHLVQPYLIRHIRLITP